MGRAVPQGLCRDIAKDKCCLRVVLSNSLVLRLMPQGYVKMLWRSDGSPVWSIIRLPDSLHVPGLQLSRCGWQQCRCLCLQLGLTSLAAMRKTFPRQFILKEPSKVGQVKQGLEMPVFPFVIDWVEFTGSVIAIQQQMEDTWPQISEQCFSFHFLSLPANTRRFPLSQSWRKVWKYGWSGVSPIELPLCNKNKLFPS